MNKFYKTSDSYQQGSKTLSQQYYTSSRIYNREINQLFMNHWICVGRYNELDNIGSYFIKEIGDESILICKESNNVLKAYYNICRHRGTRLCTKMNGQLSKSISCPYHGWTYNLRGQLIGAPNMESVKEFNKENYSLHSIPINCWEGFIFINLSDSPINFDLNFSILKNKFTDWNLESLMTLKKKTYYINCNWKLIIQNYSECYHCPIIHPNLSKITPYTSGKNDCISGNILGGYMDIKTDSITKNKKLSGPILGNLSAENLKRVYYYSIFPNLLLSVHPDYVMYHSVWPKNIDQCIVECSWMFSNELSKHADYQPNNAIDFWDKTNLEDWNICEQSYLGIKSSKYSPGPYSGQESLLAAYDNYYLDELGNY